MKVNEFLEIKKIYGNGIGLVVPMEDVRDAIGLVRAEEKDTAVECMKIALQRSEEEALKNKGSYQDPVVKFKELIRKDYSGIEIPNIKELLSKGIGTSSPMMLNNKVVDWGQRRYEIVKIMMSNNSFEDLCRVFGVGSAFASNYVRFVNQIINLLKESEGK